MSDKTQSQQCSALKFRVWIAYLLTIRQIWVIVALLIDLDTSLAIAVLVPHTVTADMLYTCVSVLILMLLVPFINMRCVSNAASASAESTCSLQNYDLASFARWRRCSNYLQNTHRISCSCLSSLSYTSHQLQLKSFKADQCFLLDSQSHQQLRQCCLVRVSLSRAQQTVEACCQFSTVWISIISIMAGDE